jgi:hypothetical protein
MSPDMSITPAPFTPTIPGHTPHSRADDHASAPPLESSATILRSLLPAIQRHLPGHASGLRPTAPWIPEHRWLIRHCAHSAQTCSPVAGMWCVTKDVRQMKQRRPP